VLIGFLIGWVADKSALRMFLCVVATMWFGCSNGAQQIVGELPIFRRERVSGQGLNAYLLSKLGFLSLISLAQAGVLLIVTLFCSQVIFHPEQTDSQNLEKEFAARLVPVETAASNPSAQEEFDAVDVVAPNTNQSTKTTPAESAKKPPTHLGLYFLKPLLLVSRFFQVSQNIIDSGPRVLTRNDGRPLTDSKGQDIIVPGTGILKVLLVTLGLRWLAVAAAAVTGVGIGLLISSLVSNTTQAVLWVPLILIPQILFGGIVVTVADMSSSVRTFSHVMPSFAAQRIMDVGSVYGLMTPFLTNRTKTPLFLTSRGDKENVEWEKDGQSFTQSYDKLSPVNTSWQNMAVIPERLGQHKQVGDRSENGFRIEYRDTVESRRDVRYSKGTVFRSLADYYSSVLILSLWVGLCYLGAFFGLLRKQTGK
jgi:hypothetical protein